MPLIPRKLPPVVYVAAFGVAYLGSKLLAGHGAPPAASVAGSSSDPAKQQPAGGQSIWDYYSPTGGDGFFPPPGPGGVLPTPSDPGGGYVTPTPPPSTPPPSTPPPSTPPPSTPPPSPTQTVHSYRSQYNGVNVRTSPSTTAGVVRQVGYNTSVTGWIVSGGSYTANGRTSSSWIRIQTIAGVPLPAPLYTAAAYWNQTA